MIIKVLKMITLLDLNLIILELREDFQVREFLPTKKKMMKDTCFLEEKDK